MNKSKASIYKWVSTLFFAISAILFWRLWQPSLMSFHEEFQLFIFDKVYICDRLFTCGGLAILVGEFLTQFFTSLWLGAAIIALLYVAIQQFSWSIARTIGANDYNYPLSFIPAIAIWLYMSDGNVMMSYVVSVTIALGAVALLAKIKSEKIQVITAAICLPILFVSISIGAYIFAASAVITHFLQNNNRRRSLLYLLAMVVYTIIIVVITYRLSSYELWRISIGIYLFRVKFIVEWMNIVMLPIITILPFAIARFNLFNKIDFSRSFAIEMAIVAVIGAFSLYKLYDQTRNHLIEYDYYVRNENWNKIISKASQHQNGNVFEALSLNLALAVTGQLHDRIFEFEQHGPDGLLPPFPNDNMTMGLAAEIYLRIGMVNIAQRTFFEAQENIMTDVKSGRFSKRLAEISIINGEYKVARKYIDMLKKTYAYRKWAIENESIVGNESAIDSHPLYGEMRRLRTSEDFYYSDDLADQIAGYHFNHNNNNLIALDYALCHQILSGKSDSFAATFTNNMQKAPYDHFPIAYQEALAYEWRRKHNSFEQVPWKLSPTITQNYESFASIYSANPKDKRLKHPPYSKTMWGYMANH